MLMAIDGEKTNNFLCISLFQSMVKIKEWPKMKMVITIKDREDKLDLLATYNNITIKTIITKI